MDFSNLDLIVLMIIVGFGIIGYVKGAVNTLISFLGMIASFVIAGLFSPMITENIVSSVSMQSYLKETVAQRILSGIQQYGVDFWSQIPGDTLMDGVRLMPSGTLEGAQVQEMIADALTPLMTYLVGGIVFLGLLILTGILIHFIKRAGSGINSVPVIGFFNRLTGAGIGIVFGLIVVTAMTGIVYTLGLLMGNLEWVQAVQSGGLTGEILTVLSTWR